MKIAPIRAEGVSVSKGKTNYPEPFADLVKGRTKRKLGDIFDLTNFGVNLTELDPGSASSVKHCHTKQDEFIFILRGTGTVIYGEEEFPVSAGDCIGFKAGTGMGHQLVNRSSAPVVYLEVGDRTPNDDCVYPDDDLCARSGEQGTWRFTHTDGTPY
ncbi:MAG: cupin domain-containing protein [Halioglobus sp.]